MYDYEQIARIFPGWPLSEIKALPATERRYWVEVARHRVAVAEARLEQEMQ